MAAHFLCAEIEDVIANQWNVALRSSLAPTLGELSAKLTERANITLSAALRHLSHRERPDCRKTMSLRGSAHTAVAIPRIFKHFRS